ncbi:nitrite reductase (NADH) large subunit [Alteromonadaceae bacterium Bs31]|nr:nitrite reductase (NADH) large subunit [Alteromonadaceae bacterium Bs31]
MEATTENSTPSDNASVVQYQRSNNSAPEQVLVLGSGPVGVRFCHDYLKRRPFAALTLIGDEAAQPYNRVQLSTLLAGEVSMEDIINPLPDVSQFQNFRHVIARIVTIDSAKHCVTDNLGVSYSYSRLVLAVGSSAHLPNIPNVRQRGVYTFRNLRDTEFLYSRIASSRHVVVVGGGLLGIEAARALRRANTEVTLVHQGQHLMNRQLNETAAGMLQRKVEAAGISVIINSGAREVLGDVRVEGVRLRDGTELACDTVLLCAGIKPNIGLARQSKIKVARGIVVNDKLETSEPDIYAIGECCEHRGATYGLVNPGLEQAAVAADCLADLDAHYIGSLEVSRLKVLGETVCSMGDIVDPVFHAGQRQWVYRSKRKNIYRKIVVTRGKITGALCFGDWDEIPRVQEAFQSERKILPWQILRFLLTGYLWTEDTDVALWPASAVICQCNSISQGQLVEAIKQGCTSVAALRDKTRASSTCGSCKPLLQSLLGENASPEKQLAWLPTLALSCLAIIFAAVVVLVPGLEVGDSVQNPAPFENIWNDKFNKQVTGFSLLGMSLVGLFMSLRKRLKFSLMEKLGNYGWWRFAHVFLGAACAGLLFLHTGLHLGENLNFLLLMNFIAVLILGALTGLVVSMSHLLSPPNSRKLKSFWNWAHTLVVWPLPALLGIHILTVYYF